MKRTKNLRRLIGAGLGCVVLGATVVAMAVPAGAADGTGTPAPAARHRVHLTVAQRQCLKAKGITRPIRPLTPEKVAQLKAAAQACDIKLPLRKHVLTAAQRQCMQQQGITRPIRPLTAEKVQKIKDAAKACGVQLPARFGAKATA
jgi:mRNA-degrading endonuclease toxin of MazEF toxin-antitoxin module